MMISKIAKFKMREGGAVIVRVYINLYDEFIHYSYKAKMDVYRNNNPLPLSEDTISKWKSLKLWNGRNNIR